MNIDLYGPEGTELFAILQPTLKRIATMAKYELMNRLSAVSAQVKVDMESYENYTDMVQKLEEMTTEAKVFYTTLTEIHRLRNWLDRLPQPTDLEENK